jgi:glycosyltransferase involved in cell wall biosynthesis
MSVYNGSLYLREGIESILGQTFSNFEFIIVDDGSTDDSYDILFTYKDPRINLIHKEHTGLTHSLNVGLAQAKGIWVARIDCDDIAEPHRLTYQLESIKTNPQLVLVGSNCNLINSEGHILWPVRFPAEHETFLRHIEHGGSPFPHSSAVFLLRAALEVGGYNERFLRSQDIDLWFRLFEKGRIACIQESLVRLRKHDYNISSTDGWRKQIIYGVAARVSYERRRQGLPDPSHGSEEEWNGLLARIEAILTRTGTFSAIRSRAALREEAMRRANGQLPSNYELSKAIMRSPKLMWGFAASSLYRWALRQII